MNNKNDKVIKIEKFKPMKQANCIAIGGMISAGKSTLVQALSKAGNWDVVYELDDNDKNGLMYILLTKMYEGEKIAPSVCQLQFMLSRYENYKNAIDKDNQKFYIFDRTIFEDRLFAFHNLISDPEVFMYYEHLWKGKVNELVYNVGIPKLYVILDIDWDTFKDRLFTRKRSIETDNFKKNEEYFRCLNSTYTAYLKNVCDAYSIPYIVVDAKTELEKKVELIMKKIKSL